MKPNLLNTSPVQDALVHAEQSFVPVTPEVSVIDSVEDMLDVSESVQVAKNYLAQRYHELQPDLQDLPDEHKARVVHHVGFLRDVGKISAREWERIGLGEDEPARQFSLGAAEALIKRDPHYISSLTRPDWQEHFPKDDNEESRRGWEEFKAKYPEDMQVVLEDLYTDSNRLKAAHESGDLVTAFEEAKERRYDVLMAASCVRSLERTARQFRARAMTIKRSIPEGSPSPSVLKHAKDLESRAKHFEEQAGQFLVAGKTQGDAGETKVELNEALVEELARRKRLDDRRELRHGLLVTDDMNKLITDFVPQLQKGKPVLLVGETGGAKTAAAEEMARQVNIQNGKDPNDYEFVSGYGQMNSYQLMGKDVIRTDENGSFTEFAYGAVTRAMIDGKPIIIDEANATDPTDIQKRFNKILQLKPGDTFQIQEDGGEQIVVKQGFCLIMTANEKNERYHSVFEMAADFKARFGSNVGRVSYPDLNVLPGQVPQTLLRLAEAKIVDKYGNIPEDNPALKIGDVLKFVSACHRLQRKFCIPLESLQQTERAALTPNIRRNQTALQSETIAPRMMTEILESLVNGGRSGATLSSILNRYVEGVTNESDRAVIRAELRDLI